MQVADEVLHILGRSAVVGNRLSLPPGQLDRATYAAVNKVLEAAGGKWNRGQKCHVFADDAADTIEPILLTGEYARTKQDFGQFDTPDDVALTAVNWLRITPGMSVLEPNVGLGNLAHAAERAGARVTGVEIDAARLAKAKARCKFVDTVCTDFLTLNLRDFPAPFDAVLMNPPFAKKADIAHVLHATTFVKRGGHIVAIMGASLTFRQDAKTDAFRAMLDARGASIQPLPAGSFKESGTGVNAVMVSFGVE